ncbi:MAG: hypothetical protein AAGI68_15285 [Planctomycetota bacterium]
MCALIFAAAVATAPVQVSVELMRAGPWAVSEGLGLLGLDGGGADDPWAGLDPDKVFLCAGHGCGCQSAASSAAGCCCYPTVQQRMKRARALAMAGLLESGQCGVPRSGADEVAEEAERVERELPLEGPGWRSLSCRGVAGLLLGMDVRHWQPSAGGVWYPLAGPTEAVWAGPATRVVNASLAVDAPPPERV